MAIEETWSIFGKSNSPSLLKDGQLQKKDLTAFIQLLKIIIGTYFKK